MQQPFDHIESIYWVFTQLCNDQCDHCYNNSGPRGERITLQECLAIVGNLPRRADRIILSGGEPLAERATLYAILDALRAKYGTATQIMLQTNGDLLTGRILDELLARGVTRIDIASIDRYHKHSGARRQLLEDLFHSRGMSGDDTDPLIEKETYLKQDSASYGFWGATEEMWLGGNWARGRAMEKGVWMKDHTHNFCAILSGGRGFLGGTELPQEISIQLWKINPCCPGTLHPMGDARTEKVSDVLGRVADSAVMQAINQGDPYGMGESIGISREEAMEVGARLGNICLWCDRFFARHFDLQQLRPRTPGAIQIDLPVLPAQSSNQATQPTPEPLC
ncbi:MAG: radical SAM protein [Armatimonadetes bacterium]|nr:radical SAM protein [Armatimonadota bacterium]